MSRKILVVFLIIILLSISIHSVKATEDGEGTDTGPSGPSESSETGPYGGGMGGDGAGSGWGGGGGYCGNGVCGDSYVCTQTSYQCWWADVGGNVVAVPDSWYGKVTGKLIQITGRGVECGSVCVQYSGENCNTCPQDCGSCCVSYQGQACGGCGRGTYDCNGNCNGDYSNCGGAGWYNYGGGCGACGTQQQYCNGCDWTGSYQCVNQGPCLPGQVEYGKGCGNCGTSRRDCAGNCQWGGWYCTGDNPNYGQACGSCGGKIQCDGTCSVATPVTKRDCREYSKKDFEGLHHSRFRQREDGGNECDEDQATCDQILKEIVNNKFFACPPNDADTACCPTSSCVYNGQCYPNGFKLNIGDGVGLVCVAHSPGQWVADCTGSVNGFVKNQINQSIVGAVVSANQDLTTVQTSTTNQQGLYNLTGLSCGPYNLVASYPNYVPKTQYINVTPQAPLTFNFTDSNGLVLGSSCESDCTYVSDDIIHASCDGKNGCTFYDAISKAACDNSQPGWVRDYDSTHYVVCASGAPQPKVEIQASVSCASGMLIKMTRIVLYNGKPVKLVTAVCG